MTSKKTRRNFIFSSIAVAGGIAAAHAIDRPDRETAAAPNNQAAATVKMPERVLGKTAVKVPIFGLGGAGQTPLSQPGREAEAAAQIERAIELGIRYFDTAADYGPSEENLGKVLPQSRSRLFLATKTAARDRDGAWRDLERSLKRLKTDRLDLWQLHHVSFTTELDQIFSTKGAIKAIEEAKQQKIIRFSGITGHHEPAIIAAGLQRYPFDTTLISLNAAEKHHPRSFTANALPVAKAKNIGVIAMKIPAYGKLFQNGVLDGMHQAMGYTLSLPGVHCCVIAADSVKQLEENLKVAQAFKPLSKVEMAAIEKRTAAAWQENTFFRQWT
ncbi:aldo/keto reductase [Microcoleus sp. LEGE 07076]|uniref:aldo/keto reductase n=1 Tax=Microcoleus sp. LEGE 07076 TaxID=915322 RepID=UPI00187F479A|nr:aldo/keto reductase [Microcoleus sp. LEGE 07076]MBE9188148.1 aldo/keto reductase [Microcoleus sp. LEGE 07076]